MIFELTDNDLKTALKEYMVSRDILNNNRDFTFHVKTSRRGERNTRTIIETKDTVAKLLEPTLRAVEPIPKPQLELPMNDPDEEQEEDFEPAVEEIRTPFKKLFG